MTSGQRAVTQVQHRYGWRHIVAFVHRASSCGPFHLAATVSIPLFEMELAAFERQVGAGPRTQIMLVLGRAGWHTSVRLRVPDHTHLLFLPAYSPELQPAKHLWPLTDTALANRHFDTIDDLEDAQAAHCAAWERQPDRLRAATLFHW